MARTYESVILGGGTPRAFSGDYQMWYSAAGKAEEHTAALKEGGIVVKNQPWTGRKACSVCEAVCWNVITDGGSNATITHEEDARRRLERKIKKENKQARTLGVEDLL
jgi:hypothetical protein